jgi:hypothetical protein
MLKRYLLFGLFTILGIFLAPILLLIRVPLGNEQKVIFSESLEYLKIFSDLLKAVAWPIVFAVLLLYFKDDISKLLQRSQQIAIKIPGIGEVSLTLQELSSLIDGFNNVLSSQTTPAQKKLFWDIKDFPGKPVVGEVLVGFDRMTKDQEIDKKTKEYLTMLRALRGFGLIRPAEGLYWYTNTPIEVTDFGKLVVQYMPNALLPEEPHSR